MKPFTILFLVLLLGYACTPYKAYDVNKGIVNQHINTAGAYTFRLCKEPIVFEGVQLSVFQSCSDKSTNLWNQLTCFIFIDEQRVEYHSLRPEPDSRSVLSNRFRNPSMSGWYEVDSTGQHIRMHLRKGKWREKNLNRAAPIMIELEVRLDGPDEWLYVHKVSSVDGNLIKVYDPDDVFQRDSSLIYCFEPFQLE
ncbi:MAG: hypothetical protein AAFV95_20700 [Bacteroidota bacterium]